MGKNKTSILAAFFTVVALSFSAFSQEPPPDDIDDLDALLNQPTTQQGQTATTEQTTGLTASGTTEESAGENSITLLTDDPKRDEFAMHGWSIGFAGFAQNFNAYYEIINPATGEPISGASRSGELFDEPVQYAGLVVRYAILPVNRLGTDINFSAVTSLNHDSVGITSSSISRLEGNLAYTQGISAGVKLYIFLGAGVQYVNGKEFELMIQHLGYGGQAGGGLSLSRVNIDVMYSQYRNRIRGDYNDRTTVLMAYDTNDSHIDSSGLVGRFTFNF